VRERAVELPHLTDRTDRHLVGWLVDQNLKARLLRRGRQLVQADRGARRDVTGQPAGHGAHGKQRAHPRRARQVGVPD
jgi:hypothetical protein